MSLVSIYYVLRPWLQTRAPAMMSGVMREESAVTVGVLTLSDCIYLRNSYADRSFESSGSFIASGEFMCGRSTELSASSSSVVTCVQLHSIIQATFVKQQPTDSIEVHAKLRSSAITDRLSPSPPTSTFARALRSPYLAF